MLKITWTVIGKLDSDKIYAKADAGPARRARAPPFKKNWFVFVCFYCITRSYFESSQHAMFTMCILFTTQLQKLRVYL